MEIQTQLEGQYMVSMQYNRHWIGVINHIPLKLFKKHGFKNKVTIENLFYYLKTHNIPTRNVLWNNNYLTDKQIDEN